MSCEICELLDENNLECCIAGEDFFEPSFCPNCGEPLTQPEPLTQEELRERIGEPVFIQLFGDLDPGYWSVITQVDDRNVWFENGLHERFDRMGDTWLAYTHKPRQEP